MPDKQKSILNTMKNLYSSLDGYASGVSFTVNKNDTSKSIIGATLTIAIVIITFVLSADPINNVIYITNPRITLDQEHGIQSIENINFSNFFIAYSFFSPKNSDTKFSNQTNDYQTTSTMRILEGTCLNNCSNATFNMPYCNEDVFQNVSELKGLPAQNSKNVTDIFRVKSYCLPQQFEATFLDDDSEINDFVSSLTIYIPDTWNQTQSLPYPNRNLGKNLVNK